MVSFKEFFLIKIHQNYIYVQNLKTGDFRESKTDIRFGNNRLLITDTEEPENTIRLYVNQLSNSLIKPYRTIILSLHHPSIDKFSEVEKMIFRDLAGSIGANELYLSFQQDINRDEIDLKTLSAQFEV